MGGWILRSWEPGWRDPVALAALGVILVLFGAGAIQAQSGVPDGYELVYSQDFADASALDDFTFSDKRAWKYGNEGGRG